MKKLVFAFLFCFLGSSLNAQIYRPSVEWHSLKTSHFNIIFHSKNDSLAKETAKILEHHYKPTQDLTGGSLNNFPVVLNGYNDFSNGFVSPFNFRMEVEIPPIKGKILNPKAGGWLENVLPHELVHAQHFSVVPKLGLPGLIYPFWPDAARSFHFSAQVGFHEGLAVYYESNILNDVTGRGNHPFFTNQTNAIFSSSQRWGLGQMVQSSAHTRPYDRHYLGGFEFVSWVQHRHGDKAARDMIDFIGRWPFLGYGFAYWWQTKQFPLTGFKEYESQKLAKERERQAVIREQNVLIGQVLDTDATGESLRRPIWISDSTLVVFGSFYDLKSGLFTLDIHTSELDRIATTQIVEDFKLDLSPDKKSILFARYDIDLKYDSKFISGVYSLDLDSKKVVEFKSDAHFFNAVRVENEVWAFQTKGQSNQLISITKNEVLINPNKETLVDFAYSPISNKIALVANRNGSQALWVCVSDSIRSALQNQALIHFENGSIYDPVWHPDGTKLLFTSDHTGVMNSYEYDFVSDETRQLSNTLFNAFEASYSADGNTLALIVQQENEQKVAILPRTQFSNVLVDSSLWKNQPLNSTRLPIENSISASIDSLKSKPYSSGFSWLKPRGVIPFYQKNSLGDKIGLGLIGTDVLQKHTWFGEVSSQYESFWYDFSYLYTGFWPGLELSAFKKPVELPYDFILSESGFSVGIPLKFNLEQNVSFSSFTFKPSIKRTQFDNEVFFSGVSTTLRDKINSLGAQSFYSFRLEAQFNYKLIQRSRDLQPSEGLILFGNVDLDLSKNTFYSYYFEYLDEHNLQSTYSYPNKLERDGYVGGIYVFMPVFTMRNQSLRLGSRLIHQPNLQVYNLSDIIWFSTVRKAFFESKTILEFSTRYTFPLFFPENGGFLIPWYLQNIYGVAFTRSHIGFNHPQTVQTPTNTVFGIGLRYTTGIGNLRFDLGISYIYTSRIRDHHFWAGDF